MHDVLTVDKKNLGDIINGAAFLGAGGGGPLALFLKLAGEMPDDFAVEVRPVDEAPDVGLTVVTGFLGAPRDAANLRAADLLDPSVTAFDRYAIERKQSDGAPCVALMPFEVGAGNSLTPIFLAWVKGLPVIDADGAGRAVPTLTLTTFAHDRLAPIRPAVVAGRVDAATLWTDSVGAVEGLVRGWFESAQQLGQRQLAAVATWGMDTEALRRATPIRGSLVRCLRIGELMRTAAHPMDDIAAYLDETGMPAKEIFRGVLDGGSIESSWGFDHGRIRLVDGARTAYVFSKNENMTAWSDADSRPLALAPDLICYYLPRQRRSITNAEMVAGMDTLKGEEVRLIRVRCNKALWEIESLRKAFADTLLDLDYGGRFEPGRGPA